MVHVLMNYIIVSKWKYNIEIVHLCNTIEHVKEYPFFSKQTDIGWNKVTRTCLLSHGDIVGFN